MRKIFSTILKAYRLERLKHLLELVLTRYGTDSAVHNRIAIIYAKVGEFSLAEKSFEHARDIQPSAASFHNLGLVYFEMKKYKKSLAMFEKAIKLDGDLASRHIAYAKVLEKLHRSDDVIAALERAVELDPTPTCLRILYDAYMRYRKKAKARDLKRALNRFAERDEEINVTDRLIKSTRDFNDRLDEIAKERGLA